MKGSWSLVSLIQINGVVLQFGAWNSLLMKAGSDFLPGEKYAEVDRTLASQTASKPRHDKFLESVFTPLGTGL